MSIDGKDSTSRAGDNFCRSDCKVPDTYSLAMDLDISLWYRFLSHSNYDISAFTVLARMSMAASTPSSSVSSFVTFSVAFALSWNITTFRYPGADRMTKSLMFEIMIFVSVCAWWDSLQALDNAPAAQSNSKSWCGQLSPQWYVCAIQQSVGTLMYPYHLMKFYHLVPFYYWRTCY